jgi:hypothetical protein
MVEKKTETQCESVKVEITCITTISAISVNTVAILIMKVV